jgi:organic radical activating enzyme
MTTLKISEIFGPTIQGEGSTAGQFCCFLRLSGCNLKCGWCDTKYAAFGTFVETLEVLDRLFLLLPRRVVITGGEPLLQQGYLQPVVTGLREAGIIVDVETNGTIIPTLKGVCQYSVSPKLRNACKNGLYPGVLTYFATQTNCIFKFVCASAADVRDVGGLGLENSKVWIMPEGVSVAALDRSLQAILPTALEYGYNISDRLQIRLWGNKKGV